MKYLLLFAVAAVIFGCDDNTTSIVEHKQLVSPKTLVFAKGESVKNLSITHTCTCPFSWNVNVLTVTPALKDTSGTNDNASVPISIDRTKLPADSVIYATFEVASNYANRDTVQVTIVR